MSDIIDRVSYHAVYDDTTLSALQFAHLNGFSGVQVADECPHLSFNRIGSREREQLKVFLKETGCNLSLHAPDEAVSFFITNDLLLEGIFNYYEALVSFAVAVGAHIITIHLGSPVLFRTDSIPEEPYPQQDLPIYREALRSGIDRLIALVDGRLILCVENYKMDHEILQMLDRHIGAGDLFLCWDVAKSRSRPEVQEYFLQHLDSVKQVHLHDSWQKEGTARSHRVIGSGEFDFTQLLPILARADVHDYCIEVRPREMALQSLEALKRMVTELDL